MHIVPALLGQTWDEFLARLRQAEVFADYVQIDLMDGGFVPTTSFPGALLSSLETRVRFEVHLMVNDPVAWLSSIRNPSLGKVVFHTESAADPFDVLHHIRERGLEASVALRPETPIQGFEEIIDQAGAMLFLTVDPGRYGSPFRPEVLEKVRAARSIFPRHEIAADGGVSLENLTVLARSGVDVAVVGSRIFAQDNPSESYRAFVERAGKIRDED